MTCANRQICYFKACIFASAFILLSHCSFSRGQVQPQSVPSPTPAFCKKLTEKGPCRATLTRYRFNAKKNKCETFIYGGCGASKNLFFTKSECMRMCHRNEEHQRAFGSSSQVCNFKVNLARNCAVKRFDDFEFCSGLTKPGQSKETCQSRGCCRLPSAGLCYQQKSALAKTSCQIVYSSNTWFYGKIVFQGNKVYEKNWVGHLSFSKAVTNALCIVRDFGVTHAFNITESLQNRKGFFIKGGKRIIPGKTISITFRGDYNRTNFEDSQCGSISRP